MSDKKRKQPPKALQDEELEKAQGGAFGSVVAESTLNTALSFNTADDFNTADRFNTAGGGFALNDSPLKR